MADMLYLQDEEGDNSDEGVDNSSECDVGPETRDEFLPPLVRLQKYCMSDNMFHRQMVARMILETLRAVADDPSDVASIVQVVHKLADDPEGPVRAELVEQVPHIAMLCHEDKGRLSPLVLDHLLPLIIKYLADNDNQVRKTAQAALLLLMEQGLLDQGAVELKVCPVILMLTEMDSLVEFHTGAVALMSKMAPLIGKDSTERLFLSRFAALCTDPVFYVRKVCASNFGEFCAVVGTEATENILLPRFVDLCEDEIWGVRKACAEAFMSVSCTCTLQTRKQSLAPVFVNLLVDQSRWVRMSAFQTLGPFISTFADPSITGLSYNEDGYLVIMSPEGFEFRLVEKDCTRLLCEATEETEGQRLNVKEEQRLPRGQVHIHVDNTDCFNTFQYWRLPIPELEVDISLEDTGKPTAVRVKATVTDKASQRTYASELNVDMEIDTELENLSSRLEECSVHNAQISSSSVAVVTDTDKKEEASKTVIASNIHVFDYKNAFDTNKGTARQTQTECAPQVDQNIVPQQLIDHFISMTDPSQAHTTDNEIAHHCAYSLPAVALTLGRENWILLKEAYDALASDMQWKVRRTVASSIHQLAVILGEELATKDLVPVFNGFIKDLDEVRIGALKHLAEFLKLLRPSERNSYLPRLSEFLLTDNEWNWRFREELAEQLLEAVNLFSPEDTRRYLTPIAISLLVDKVAAVRQVALRLVTELVKHMSVDAFLLHSLLLELTECFANSKRWSQRQTFVLLCSLLVTKHALSEEMFASDVLPHLLDLSWDRVPNVRLSVARTLSTNIMTQDFFLSEVNPRHEVLVNVLKRLQNDTDRDVRYFASLGSSTTTLQEDSTEPDPAPA